MDSTRAIVLSRDLYSEADLYIQFLTRDWGVLTLLAKSARKSRRRYAGGLDLFCHNEIFVRGLPARPYLSELTVLNAFTGLRDNLDRVELAGKAVQWVRRLCPISTPLPVVYRLLGQTLALTEKEGDRARLELLGLIFKLKLLSEIGLKPRMDSCVGCGDTDTTEGPFDMESGGLLCRPCAIQGRGHGMGERLYLSREDRGLLTIADRFRFTAWSEIHFPDERSQELNRLVTRFASYHTHERLPV